MTPFQVLFRCPLNKGINKGNKFGDFGYYPLNRGCPDPHNTVLGFTVRSKKKKRKEKKTANEN